MYCSYRCWRWRSVPVVADITCIIPGPMAMPRSMKDRSTLLSMWGRHTWHIRSQSMLVQIPTIITAAAWEGGCIDLTVTLPISRTCPLLKCGKE